MQFLQHDRTRPLAGLQRVSVPHVRVRVALAAHTRVSETFWHIPRIKTQTGMAVAFTGITINFQRSNNVWSDPGGSRTRDLRIKSPLLYQLSYRVSLTS